MSSSLIDIGANLTHDCFDDDLDAVLDRAASVNIKKLIVTGASESGSQKALQLAQKYSQLYATAGVHPHEADSYNADIFNTLKKLTTEPKVVAVGECGLDFFRDFSTHDNQESCFRSQLELAFETQKPIFLHQRDAHESFVKLLSEYIGDLNKAVVHCFTGTEEELDAYLELGCYIGITGWICDERRGLHLHDFVGKIPANKLMLETDAPYLLPRTIKPKPKTRRNEPYYLTAVLETVASIIGKPEEQVAQESTAVAREFFGI